tara:strand:+ start:216 stop:1322 length:1107 start_codon:yes stop_codon:yes gene_type:complete
LRVKTELSPTITKKSRQEYLVAFWYENKRYRYSSGKAIGLELQPNIFPVAQRLQQVTLLCAAYTLEIAKGWRPEVKPIYHQKTLTIGSIAAFVLLRKLSLSYSESYKKELEYTEKVWKRYISNMGIEHKPIEALTTEIIRDFIYSEAPSPASMRNLKRNISALLKDELEANGTLLSLKRIPLPKTAQELHKPISNVAALLAEVKDYNYNLYLCCLMTYVMLLRPHREIRCLTFTDFNTDFSQVSLNGNRVKSKRNRVIPIPSVVQRELQARYSLVLNRRVNVFTLKEQERHKDYFKGLWTKYKNQSVLLEPQQTLYSFRHTGAINVFEKTGSLLKLQQVMGHSTMQVSLTYLRGLEVSNLDVSDLPSL